MHEAWLANETWSKYLLSRLLKLRKCTLIITRQKQLIESFLPKVKKTFSPLLPCVGDTSSVAD